MASTAASTAATAPASVAGARAFVNASATTAVALGGTAGFGTTAVRTLLAGRNGRGT
ncbi:hypothetical protein [Streptomyces lunaelactis]|uniref:hypothetical protein n=1 Tax=Streptomyces lunaelactis TaxID=1535768 RepID=UPI0020C77CFC|nr:hypothetical protein [Streptomyces lunaelactis]